ncbi:hypothetical protein [Aureimonas sp. SK2]|uniref:hypothetical protein n=1 Tax=Aureimonas sp. SK2 TaxID=3015992 RepID=UPI002444B2C3|nr:hypothetical protein [Aureimonas sp. SK2]
MGDEPGKQAAPGSLCSFPVVAKPILKRRLKKTVVIVAQEERTAPQAQHVLARLMKMTENAGRLSSQRVGSALAELAAARAEEAKVKEASAMVKAAMEKAATELPSPKEVTALSSSVRSLVSKTLTAKQPKASKRSKKAKR